MILFVRYYYLSQISSFQSSSLHVLNFNSGVMFAICRYCALLPLNLDSKLQCNKKTDKIFQNQDGEYVHVCMLGVHVCVYLYFKKVVHNTPSMQIKEQIVCKIIQHLGVRKEASSYFHLSLSNVTS